MDPEAVLKKFGGAYTADEKTFKMGIHHRFTDHIARRFEGRTVLETCTGGGFSTIALAGYAKRVVTVEIDASRSAQAAENAKRARVAGKISFVRGDVLDEAVFEELPDCDAAFLDPDWADTAPGHVYRFVDSNTEPPADVLLQKVFGKTGNVALILPPAIDVRELDGLPGHEREKLYFGDSHELYCLYFGELVAARGETAFEVKV